MNYRNIAISELNETANKFPQNSIGQVVLSVIQKRDNKDISVQEWLMNVTDEDFFTAIEKANQAEQPEVEFFNKD